MHRSNANLHRGWKTHPVGGLMRLGTSPGMEAGIVLCPRMSGKAATSPWVYGCFGSVNTSTVFPTSIMYGGKMMEVGKTVDVFTDPKHPYTQGLVAAFPDIRGQRTMPASIPGDVPSLINPPTGCVFHPRCKFAFDRCISAEPALADVTPGRRAACFLYPEVSEVPPRTITMEVH